MQQNFTPMDGARFKAVGEGHGAPTKTSDSAQVEKLMMQLLQLHLMHRSAFKTQYEWEKSAHDTLRDRFNDLCCRSIEVREIADQQTMLFNQFALTEWCQGMSNAQLAEKVQQLSLHVTNIAVLLESEGRYTSILAVFESWLERARQIQAQREAEASAQDAIVVIDSIGDGWKAEATVLEREISYALRELKDFGQVRPASGLGRILSLHKTLLSNLLEELDVIQGIENELVQGESIWIDQMISSLSLRARKTS